jgi:predicted TPR repeat methyltransferase
MNTSPIATQAEEYSHQAHMLQEHGLLDEAVDSYQQALAIKPDFAEVYGELGNVFKEQGKLDQAIASYRQAVTIKPDYAKAYINLGVVLQEGGLLVEAAANYQRALTIKADYVAAHFNLGALHMSLGHTEDALHAFRTAIAIKPDLAPAAHMISVLEGRTTETAPQGYVQDLFDRYACNFEQHLLRTLEYKTPQLLFQKFTALVANQWQRTHHALDLGCGTGLTGELFRGLSDRLSGVDLSARMLAIARDKGIYDTLHQGEICSFLNTSDDLYDLFLATDVFVYVGDLERVFLEVKARSLPGAYFAFSTEWLDGEGFRLQQSARYAHSRAYIQSLCHHHGYRVALCEAANLRKDHDLWIRGDIFILQLVTNWQ